MAEVYARCILKKKRPSVALLNIGEEESKGTEALKEAYKILRDSKLNFVGNIEGRDFFTGKVDCIICDGFVGNVALKTSEGLAQMMRRYLQEEFKRNMFTRIAALVAMPVLNRFRRRVDHRRYNGATLIGLRGVVIKSHGSADVFSFGFAIQRAVEEARTGVLQHIEERMSRIQKTAA